jgi:hypothetical protein
VIRIATIIVGCLAIVLEFGWPGAAACALLFGALLVARR